MNMPSHECCFCHDDLEPRNERKGYVHCCDACARKFVDQGMSGAELKQHGVYYVRAVQLGWKPAEIQCPLCLRYFVSCSKGQRFCRMEGCISSEGSTRRYAPMRISKKQENKGELSCKTVICTPMNVYRDKLISAFPGLITESEFNETRKIIMKAALDRNKFVDPRCIAPAIFYMTLLRLNKCILHQEDVARAIGSTAVTLRSYVKKYGYLFGFLPYEGNRVHKSET